MIQAIKNIPAEKLLPKENPVVADVIRFPEILTEQRTQEMVALVEKTREISVNGLQ
jgi:hypothetical protein